MRFLRRHMSLLAGAAACLAMYAGACYAFPNFASPKVFLNLLWNNAHLGVVAVGMTFVILSGGIDLSVGSVTSFSSVVIATLIMEHGWSPAAAVVVALALGAAVGAASGLVIALVDVKPFIVTLSVMFLARGLGYLVRLTSLPIRHPQYDALASWRLPLGPDAVLSLPTLMFIAAVLIAAYVLVMTSFGRTVYAIGGGEDAATLMGLPVTRTKVLIYAISGFCAALGGVVLSLYRRNGDPSVGVGMELDAIAAVVIGGTLLTGGVGSVFGTFIGVVMIGIIMELPSWLPVALSSGSTKVAIGVLLLVFVLVQRLITRIARSP